MKLDPKSGNASNIPDRHEIIRQINHHTLKVRILVFLDPILRFRQALVDWLSSIASGEGFSVEKKIHQLDKIRESNMLPTEKAEAISDIYTSLVEHDISISTASFKRTQASIAEGLRAGERKADPVVRKSEPDIAVASKPKSRQKQARSSQQQL